MPATGSVSSGSSSVLTGPPPRAYLKLAWLWATNRCTPPSRAAARSASVPSRRSRLVCSKLRSRFFENCTSASAVAWWTIASGAVFEHGPAHGEPVEQIDGERIRTERSQALRAPRRPERPDHLVPSLDQLRNEPGADCTARTCDEDSHRLPPLGHIRELRWVSLV